MAKAMIKTTCKCCGNVFTHTHNCINRTAADNYEEWAKENITICPECYAKQQAEKAAEQLNKFTSGVALVELTGTERQVKWANEIRNDAIKLLARHYSAEDIGTEFWEKVFNKADTAKWWIDNRSDCSDITKLFNLLETIAEPIDESEEEPADESEEETADESEEETVTNEAETRLYKLSKSELMHIVNRQMTLKRQLTYKDFLPKTTLGLYDNIKQLQNEPELFDEILKIIAERYPINHGDYYVHAKSYKDGHEWLSEEEFTYFNTLSEAMDYMTKKCDLKESKEDADFEVRIYDFKCPEFVAWFGRFEESKWIYNTRLKQRRNSCGLSVTKLSELSGAHENSIIGFEKRKRDIANARYCTLRKIADALGVESVDEIVEM